MAPTDRDQEFDDICNAVGLAMMVWQGVEAAHFKLFLKMLGAPKEDICSAVYHSVESFESRHKMIGRMAHFFLQGDRYRGHRVTWNGIDGGLNKKIKDANEDRNKLAHYGIDYDVLGQEEGPDGSVTIDLGPPRWRPSDKNRVSRLMGRTHDNPEHNLGSQELRGYAGAFSGLSREINEFQRSLDLPPPQQGLLTLADLGRHLPPTLQESPSPKTPDPKETEPRG